MKFCTEHGRESFVPRTYSSRKLIAWWNRYAVIHCNSSWSLLWSVWQVCAKHLVKLSDTWVMSIKQSRHASGFLVKSSKWHMPETVAVIVGSVPRGLDRDIHPPTPLNCVASDLWSDWAWWCIHAWFGSLLTVNLMKSVYSRQTVQHYQLTLLVLKPEYSGIVRSMSSLLCCMWPCAIANVTQGRKFVH